jgi:hypothetical protein
MEVTVHQALAADNFNVDNLVASMYPQTAAIGPAGG